MDIAYITNAIYLLVLAIGVFLAFWGLGKSGLKKTFVGIFLILVIFITQILKPENTTFRDAAVALSAVAVAIIGGGALLVNFQLRKDTREKEVRDRNERLLNEIIEWAEDIRKISSESIAPSEIVLDDPTMQIAPQMDFLRLRKRYQDLNTKSAYVKAFAKIFGGNLLSAVEKIILKLDETVEILSNCLTSKASKENSEKVEEYKKSLDSCAEDLIVEATEIKTRDIS